MIAKDIFPQDHPGRVSVLMTFLGYMMANFETELTVMGARVALTVYELPFETTKLKNFDEFYKKFGKYILQAAN